MSKFSNNSRSHRSPASHRSRNNRANNAKYSSHSFAHTIMRPANVLQLAPPSPKRNVGRGEEWPRVASDTEVGGAHTTLLSGHEQKDDDSSPIAQQMLQEALEASVTDGKAGAANSPKPADSRGSQDSHDHEQPTEQIDSSKAAEPSDSPASSDQAELAETAELAVSGETPDEADDWRGFRRKKCYSYLMEGMNESRTGFTGVSKRIEFSSDEWPSVIYTLQSLRGGVFWLLGENRGITALTETTFIEALSREGAISLGHKGQRRLPFDIGVEDPIDQQQVPPSEDEMHLSAVYTAHVPFGDARPHKEPSSKDGLRPNRVNTDPAQRGNNRSEERLYATSPRTPRGVLSTQRQQSAQKITFL
eukprot:GEMP01018694.1.p1 GENE.GEMP01018694.1~~GEMP01018694.1.p1  ORF type:complete len:362 (+),score=62.22 GEMP01018694.1:864-1949(+)